MVRAKEGGRSRGHPASVYEPVSRSDPFGILVAEHALLRQQFARVLTAAGDGSSASSIRVALAALSTSIRLHLGREDFALYPVCERLFGGKGGAASVLRGDHAVIAAQLAALSRGPGSSRPASRLRVDMLRNEVDEHFAKEERILFPLTAALLSGTESSNLARRLRMPHPAGPRARV
jgi:iron-sulfur cluster repair protein YtfE (RIC family)